MIGIAYPKDKIWVTRRIYITLRTKVKRLIKAGTYKIFNRNKINLIISFSLNVGINSLSINFISEEDFEINKNDILTIRSYKS